MSRASDFAKIFGDRWQIIENLLWQMATERGLENAIGAQLEGIGDILDESKGGLTDDQYRLFLKAKVLVLRSNGRTSELIDILQILDYTTIRIWEQPPAHLQVEVCDVTLVLETDRVLRLAKGGGVGLLFVYSRFDADHVFQASGTYATEEYDTDTGAGSVYDATVGGRSAGGLR